MTKTELLELISRGENSGIEFKRDDIQPRDIAQEIVAFLNFEGGVILLGVEDDHSISGITRNDLEEWIINICRDKVKPEVIPYYETIEIEGKKIAAVTFSKGLYVHHLWHNNHRYYYIRVGSASREESPEELQRLFQQRGQIRFDLKSVSGSGFESLDLLRLKNYFLDIRNQDIPADDETVKWHKLLVNTEILVEEHGKYNASVGGLLLFGKNPNRYLPQAGITAVAYRSTEKDYNTTERVILRGPIIARLNKTNEIIDNGIIERSIEFIKRNIQSQSYIKNGRRIDKAAYPDEVIREAVVNAVAHRDYTISGTDIEISVYSDRLEIISPGRLPNTVTIERMKAGCRATRNELIKEVLRDYNYIEATGLGVPRKIIAGMLKHNGKEPDLIEEEHSFTVILWK